MQKSFIGLFIMFLGVVLLSNAWLCDDAYITFRTADNFVHGYGLRWNPVERVQVFTNPLWMFIISIFYFFTHEIYYTSIILSVGISLLTAGIFAYRIADSTSSSLLCLGMLLFSKAFIDYSTSGLENPLTHLLLVIFLLIFLDLKTNSRTLFLISLVASLGILNRMDTVLIYLPCLLYVFFEYRRLKGILVAGLGFLPFLLWEMFSLFCYGFPFPNTAYAKLNTGIPSSSLIVQGAYYFLDSLNADGVTLFIISAGILISLVKRKGRYLSLAAGILLYLFYVIKIGGDFMSGRFLTASFICSVILLSRFDRLFSWKVGYVGAWIILLVLGFRTQYPPILSDATYGKDFHYRIKVVGVSDERAFYYQWTGLLTAKKGEQMPRGDWVDEGRNFREKGDVFIVKGTIGFFSFFAGHRVHVLDPWALADPLLARLHVSSAGKSRIGHFIRDIPHGYIETLKTGRNSIKNKDLAAYYDKLTIVTRGELFSMERFREILNFNLGKYNHLIERYERKLKKKKNAN